jgi:CDP-diacylglycerol pyrophosphatase
MEKEDKNNNANINNDIFSFYMKDINKSEEQMKKVMMAEIEMIKNDFLSFVHKSKIIYENNLLKEYLENPACLKAYYKK